MIYEMNKNNKHDYSKILCDNVSINILMQIYSDTLAISTQRARAYLLLQLLARYENAPDFIGLGSVECHSVGGTANGENGQAFELMISKFLKNKYRVSAKGVVDIKKYVNINGHKKAVTFDCKTGAGDLGYYNKNIDCLNLLKENYIIWTPIYYDGMNIKNTVVIQKYKFIKTMNELGLLRAKKKTNSNSYKMSLQNINSFKSVDKVMELLNNSMNIIEFCKFYNLTVKA